MRTRRILLSPVVVFLLASTLVLVAGGGDTAGAADDGPPICTPDNVRGGQCIRPDPEGDPLPPPVTSLTSGMTVTMSGSPPFHWCPGSSIPFDQLPCTSLGGFSPSLTMYDPNDEIDGMGGVTVSSVEFGACSAPQATECTLRISWPPNTFTGTRTLIANPGFLTVLDFNLTENPPLGCSKGNNLCVIGSGGFTITLQGSGGPPTADFGFSESPTDPGLVTFQSTSTDPLGETLTANWDFGGGGASGPSPTHRFTKPGTYPVKLTVTNASGKTASVTKDVVIAAPALSVSVALLEGAAPPIDPDTEVKVRTTVAASNSGLGGLTGLTFSGDPLGISPPEAFDVTSGPTPAPPAGGFSLTKGQSRSFDHVLTSAEPGLYTLSSTVTGKDAGGQNVSATGTSKGAVSQPSGLKVTVTPSKDEVALKQEDDGTVIPEEVEVTIAVENTTADPITDVFVQPSDLAAANPLEPYDEFPAEWVGENDIRELGTIAPGATKTTKRVLKLTHDGTIAVRQIVASSDGVSSGRGVVKMTQRLILKLDAELAEGQTMPVKAGGGVLVVGSFENLSNDVEIDLPKAQRPLLDGNLGGGYLSKDDGAVIPVPLTGTLEPREEEDFVVRLRTMRPSGEDHFSGRHELPDWTEGTVVFLNPYAEVTDEADGKKKVLINSTVNEADPIEVTIDTSEPPPDNPFALEDAVLGIGGAGLERIQEILDSYWGVLDRVVQFGFDEQFRNETLGHMAKAVEYVYGILHNLGPQDFANLANEVAAVLEPVLTGETGDAIRAAVRRYSDKLQQAWQFGDQAAIFDAVRPIGRAGGDVLATLTLDEAVGRVVIKVLNARTLYREAATAGEIAQREQIFDKAKSNFPELEAYYRAGKPVPLDVVQKYMTHIEIEQAQALDRSGILSVAKPNEMGPTRLVQSGLATRKGEEIKNKTMATIEKLVFGGGDDVGKVLLRADMPKTEAEVVALFEKARAKFPDELLPEDLAAAKQIWKHRTKEWKGYNSGDLSTELGRLKQWAEMGKIPFDFQAIENGINLRKRFGYLKFAIEEGVDEAGQKIPGYWVLKMQDPITGKMLPIAGDVDFLFFMSKTGLSISKSVRQSIYELLLPALTFLHPESGSWAASLSKKLSIFTPHFRNGQPLLAVKNGRWYSVKIDERFTRFRPGTTDQFYVHLAGMPVSFGSLKHLAPFIWAESTAKFPAWMPITAFRKMFLNQGRTGGGGGGGGGAGGGGGTGGGGGGPLTLDGAAYEPAAGVYRGTERGVVQRWTLGQGWVDDPVATQELADGTFVLAPQTAVAAGTDPGDTRVEIVSQVDGGVAGSWFDVGDQVVLDPGGPNEEIATITGFGSLLFASGLKKPHDASELVAQVESVHAGAPAGPATAGDGLARTGSDTSSLVPLGVAMVVAGAVVLVLRRRRPSPGSAG